MYPHTHFGQTITIHLGVNRLTNDRRSFTPDPRSLVYLLVLPGSPEMGACFSRMPLLRLKAKPSKKHADQGFPMLTQNGTPKTQVVLL